MWRFSGFPLRASPEMVRSVVKRQSVRIKMIMYLFMIEYA